MQIQKFRNQNPPKVKIQKFSPKSNSKPIIVESIVLNASNESTLTKNCAITEYTIPLNDEPKEKLTTRRRQSSLPMTIIRRPSERAEEQRNSSDKRASIIPKRRASVPNPNVRDQQLPTKEFRCIECNETFATIFIFKNHVDKVHLTDQKIPPPTPPPSTLPPSTSNKFKCPDCENAFESYYYLRLHNCTALEKLKCTHKYCRFRATNKAQLDDHFQINHTNISKNKEKQKIKLKRKRKKPSKINFTRKYRKRLMVEGSDAALDFNGKDFTECDECEQLIEPQKFEHHIKLCEKRRAKKQN